MTEHQRSGTESVDLAGSDCFRARKSFMVLVRIASVEIGSHHDNGFHQLWFAETLWPDSSFLYFRSVKAGKKNAVTKTGNTGNAVVPAKPLVIGMSLMSTRNAGYRGFMVQVLM